MLSQWVLIDINMFKELFTQTYFSKIYKYKKK